MTTQNQTEQIPLTIIEPSKGWIPTDFKEIWKYRELLYFLIKREIQVRYKQTVLVGLTFLCAVGVGLWLSALNVQYRDIRYVIPFLVQLWMFVSPVIYPVSMIPKKYQWLLALNPMGGVIDAYRASLLGYKPIDWFFAMYLVFYYRTDFCQWHVLLQKDGEDICGCGVESESAEL